MEKENQKGCLISTADPQLSEALMRAYVAGWYDGRDGAINDDRKREIAQDLIDWVTLNK
jgi:hypothetical protein